MAILAVIDVDEQGSLKIQNFRDALEDLGATVVKTQKQAQQQSQQQSQQRDALARLTEEVRKNHMERLRQVQGLNLLTSELKTGTTVTNNHLAAVRQLSQMVQSGTLLQDKYKTALSNLAATMQAGQTVTQQQAQALQGVTRAAHQALQGSQNLGVSFEHLQRQAALLSQALGAGGLVALLRSYLTEAFNIAARNQVLATSMAVVSENTRRSSLDMEVQVQKIRTLGITTSQARDAVLDFAQANLDMAKSSELARAAQDLAVIAGMNSSQAFNRLVTAINIQQPLLLRTFGILTGLDEIYGKYARTINKTSRELDGYEKKQAFLNFILQSAAKSAGAYELSMNDVGKMIGSTDRLVEELKNRFAQALLPTMRDVVRAQHELLTWFTNLSPAVHRFAAALGVALAAVTALAAAIASFRFLAGLSLFTGLSGGVLGAAAAIGALITAYVGLRDAQETNTEQMRSELAQYKVLSDNARSRFETVEKLAEAYRKARDAGEDTTDLHTRLMVAIGKLEAIAPGAVRIIDQETVAFELQKDAIDRLVESYEELARKKLEDAESELRGLREQERDLKERLARATAQTSTEEGALVSMDPAAVQARSLMRKAQAMGLAGAAEDAAKLTKELEELQARIRALDDVIREGRGDDIKDRLAAFREDIKELAGGEAKLREIFSKLNIQWDDFKEANEARLREIQQAVSGHVEKEAQDLQKYQQAYERTFKNITQTAETTGADFAAVRDALAGAAKGTDEYASRLLRAESVLMSLEKSVPALRKQFADLEDEVEQVKATKLEEVFRKWMNSAEDAAQAVEQVMAEDRARLQLQVAEKLIQQERQFREEQIDMARHLEHLQEEMFDRTVGLHLNATERQIVANNRLYRDQIRAIEDTIRKKREALDEEFRQLELTKQARDRELAQTIERAKQRFKVELETATAIERAKQALASDRSAKEIEDDIRQIESKYREFLDTQRAQTQKHNDELYQQERAALERRREEQERYFESLEGYADQYREVNARTNELIVRESSYTYQLLKEYAADYVSEILRGFGAILTGARSFKDVFIGIFESIKNSVLRIMDDIVSASVNGLLGIGTNGVRGIPGMQQALGGLFGQVAPGLLGSTGVAASLGNLGSTGMAATPGLIPTTSWTPPVAGYAGGAAGGGLGAAGLGLGTGLLTAGGGALAGFGLGRLMPNRWAGGAVGAGAGAATGAAIGTFVLPGIGTAVGAGIGALGGFFGGLFGGGSDKRRTRQMRDEWLDSMGGWAGMALEAERIGFDYRTLMDTQKSKTFEEEVKKFQARQMVFELEAAYGGMDRLRKKAEEAGDTLEGLNSTDLNEVQAAITRIERSLELKEAKDSLARTESQMQQLRKTAQLVGFDIDKLYNARNIEEFNGFQKELNKMLEEQQVRLGSLGRAAEGLKQQAKGIAMTFKKDMEDFMRSAAPGSKMEDILRDFREGRMSDEGGRTAIQNFADTVEQRLKTLSSAASATFAGILRETGDVTQALGAISEPLDIIIDLQGQLGIEADGALQHLLQFRRTIKDNEDIATSLSGITNILTGLTDAGYITESMFESVTSDVATMWNTLMQRGVAADQALMLMQPTLQQLWQLQQKFGYAVDETTQSLINEAQHQGIVGDNFRDVNERILDMLKIIAKALGADVPDAAENGSGRAAGAIDGISDSFERAQEASARFRDAAVADLQAVEAAAEGAAWGHSPGGVREITTQLIRAQKTMAQFSRDSKAYMSEVEHSVTKTAYGLAPGESSAGGASGGSSQTDILLAEVVSAIQQLASRPAQVQVATLTDTVLKNTRNRLAVKGGL